MAIQLFHLSISDSGLATEELNAFLASHRIVTVERRFVDQGLNSYWAFCIEYLPARGTPAGAPFRQDDGPRIDYKAVLPPDEFAIFRKLRDLRKSIADAEGIPVYTIFKNEHLAQMVQRRVTTLAEIQAIPGIGEARMEKYAPKFLAALTESDRGPTDKKGDKTP